MSYGIEFTADIFLLRQDYGENVYRVQDEIDELKKNSADLKERMLMLVAGGKDMVNTKDCEGINTDAVDVLHLKFKDMLELYDEYQTELYDLYLYKEYLENKQKDNGND
jgi:hypothetical protein